MSEATGRGKAGTGVRAGGRPRCLPLPSSLPTCPPADGGGAPRPLGRRAKRGGVVRTQIFFFGGGAYAEMKGKEGGCYSSQLFAWAKIFWRGPKKNSSFRARSHVEPGAAVCGVGAWVTVGGGESCGALSDFIKLSFSFRGCLRGVPAAGQAQSCWRFWEEEERGAGSGRCCGSPGQLVRCVEGCA